MKLLLKIIIKSIKKYYEDDTFVYSSTLSFNLIVTAIPIVLLIFAFGGYFLNGRNDILNNLELFVNQQFPFAKDFIESNIQYLITKSRLIGVISVFILIWTVSRVFLTFRIVFFEIFKIPEPEKKWLYRLKESASVIILSIFLIPFLFINSIVFTFKSGLLGTPLHFFTVPLFTETVSFLNSFLLILIIYLVVVGYKENFRTIITGTFLSALFLEIIKIVFNISVLYFWRTKIIFGSLWVIFALILLVYYSSAGIIIGALIAEELKEVENW